MNELIGKTSYQLRPQASQEARAEAEAPLKVHVVFPRLWNLRTSKSRCDPKDAVTAPRTCWKCCLSCWETVAESSFSRLGRLSQRHPWSDSVYTWKPKPRFAEFATVGQPLPLSFYVFLENLYLSMSFYFIFFLSVFTILCWEHSLFLSFFLSLWEILWGRRT